MRKSRFIWRYLAFDKRTNNDMAGELLSMWNHFVPSLYFMHRKLADLGVVLIDDEVVYMSGEDGGNV